MKSATVEIPVGNGDLNSNVQLMKWDENSSEVQSNFDNSVNIIT